MTNSFSPFFCLLSASLCPSSVCLTVSLPAYILPWLPRPLTLSASAPMSCLCAPSSHGCVVCSLTWIRHQSTSSLSVQAVRCDKARIQSAAFCAAERPCRQQPQLDLNDGKSHFWKPWLTFFFFFVNLMTRYSQLNLNRA